MIAAPPLDPATVRRALLIRPRYLGDLCLTLPALDALRATCPQAKVAYVAERGIATLLEGDPRVDEVIAVDAAPGAFATLGLFARMRRFRPDLTIDFFCNPRTAVWCRASGAGVRVGYPNKGWRSAMYTHHARPRTLSATGFHLASLEALGWATPGGPFSGPRAATAQAPTPRLHVSSAALAEARRELALLQLPANATLVGFHPGARWPTRRWDPTQFEALAVRFLDETKDGIALVTGGPDEALLAENLVARIGVRARAVVGWPIARFVALQSMCAAFVCGDTGPLHTSVASGAPTLGLISRNRPAMFFPYSEAAGHKAYYARAECSPCHRDQCGDLRCLHRLSVEDAWTLLRGMLARPRTTTVEAPHRY